MLMLSLADVPVEDKFTCFTSTTVQILTQDAPPTCVGALLALHRAIPHSGAERARESKRARARERASVGGREWGRERGRVEREGGGGGGGGGGRELEVADVYVTEVLSRDHSLAADALVAEGLIH